MSEYRDLWENYCKNRVNTEDDTFSIIYNDHGETGKLFYHIVGYANIRGDNSFIIFNENGDGNLEWIPEQYLEPSLKQNVQNLEELRAKDILNSTPMLDMYSYFARMEFTWISKYMKDLIEEYWEDSGMDERIEFEKLFC